MEEPAWKVEKIILTHTGFAMGAAVVPIPVADILAISTVEWSMLHSLCTVYGINLNEGIKKQIIGIAAAATAGHGMYGAVLKLIPGFGAVAGGAIQMTVAGTVCYALGHAFKTFLENGEEFDKKKFKKLMVSLFRQGKKKANDLKDAVKEGVFKKGDIICKDPDFQNKVIEIKKYIDQNANILFIGEPGTGKEFFARYLTGPNRTFLPFNCKADFTISFKNLTSAFRPKNRIRRSGYLSKVKGGTMFIRRIDALPLNHSKKLFQLIDERYIKSKSPKRNIRIIASCNPVGKEKEQHYGITDSLYNLFTKQIFLPPLNKRRDDIPEFCEYFFKRYFIDESLTMPLITEDVFFELKYQHWSDNLEELKRFINELAIDYITNECKSPEDLKELIQTNLREKEQLKNDISCPITNTTINTLKIILPKDSNDTKAKSYFQIGNNRRLIEPVELSADQTSFLYYLAWERKNDDEYWLEHPENYRSELKNIFNRLPLLPYFEDEINIDPPSRKEREKLKTWIWDFENKRRKTIASDINKKLKNLREISFEMITRLPNRTTNHHGNYSLNKQIIFIDI